MYDLIEKLRFLGGSVELLFVHHHVHGEHIVLIEAGPRILPALPERVSTATADLLDKLGVSLMTSETVAEVSRGSIRTASGKTIAADLTVWAAGIRAPGVLSKLDGLATNRLGQLIVRRTLQTETDDNIFALGDCAACPWPGNFRQLVGVLREIIRQINGEGISVLVVEQNTAFVFGLDSMFGVLSGWLYDR